MKKDKDNDYDDYNFDQFIIKTIQLPDDVTINW